MIKWIIILLIVAAVASLLGFNTLSGAALGLRRTAAPYPRHTAPAT